MGEEIQRQQSQQGEAQQQRARRGKNAPQSQHARQREREKDDSHQSVPGRLRPFLAGRRLAAGPRDDQADERDRHQPDALEPAALELERIAGPLLPGSQRQGREQRQGEHAEHNKFHREPDEAQHWKDALEAAIDEAVFAQRQDKAEHRHDAEDVRAPLAAAQNRQRRQRQRRDAHVVGGGPLLLVGRIHP